MNSQNLIIALIGAFIVYRLYLRIRRNLGWQPLNSGRMKFVMTLSTVVGCLFLAAGAGHPVSLVSDLAGIALGIALACLGAAATRFERRGVLWHYRPNTWIGGLVSVLFLGRILFRIYEMTALGSPDAAAHGAAAAGGLSAVGYDPSAPWSSGLMLIMFAYYTVYSALLFRKMKNRPMSVR
ncbi:hypothetical protein [Paenibacillus humicola]|uniref:hypothetical protein n=1 Tax=Paenibacillus humicola TaxID=3110540 RepID=UPI00237C319A|nr:hypothetical protein [Paenibacillus humicola]